MVNPSETTCGEGHPQNVSRRTFLEVTAGMFAAYTGAARTGKARQGSAFTLAASLREFETPLCTLRLDSLTGNLCGITWRNPGSRSFRSRVLGENFRLRFPRPGNEANYFLSSGQKVSRIEARPDGVTCHYESLRNVREQIDVSAAYHIRASEGRLEFSLDIDNSSDLPLAEVFHSIVGGQNGLVNRAGYGIPGSRDVYQSLARHFPRFRRRVRRRQSRHSLFRAGL